MWKWILVTTVALIVLATANTTVGNKLAKVCQTYVATKTRSNTSIKEVTEYNRSHQPFPVCVTCYKCVEVLVKKI